MVLIIAIVIAIPRGDNGNITPDPVETPTPTEPAPPQEEQPPATEPETPSPEDDEETRERRDLVQFTIDDRSVSGFTNIWITWTITNHSSEKSDYRWDWEAVAPNGDRLANSTEYVSDVQPGQTAKGESPTTLDTTNVELNITDFDRTASP